MSPSLLRDTFDTFLLPVTITAKHMTIYKSSYTHNSQRYSISINAICIHMLISLMCNVQKQGRTCPHSFHSLSVLIHHMETTLWTRLWKNIWRNAVLSGTLSSGGSRSDGAFLHAPVLLRSHTPVLVLAISCYCFVNMLPIRSRQRKRS